MDPWLIGLFSVVFLVILVVLRVHLGLSLYFTGFLGYLLLVGDLGIAVNILATQPYATTANFTLSVLPLFLIMGVFAGHAGFARDAYDAAEKWLAGVRGGLAMGTVVANALFAAASGSSAAACAVFTKFSLPVMTSKGYQPKFACSVIVVAGTLAMMIPPSVLMIIYGMLTYESIGTLFIAGIGPGVLLAVMYILSIAVMIKLKPGLVSKMTTSYSLRNKLLATRKVWGVLFLAILVLGGIYSGVFTPTEAGAVGAFGAFILAIFLRRLTPQTIMSTLRDAAAVNAMIFFIFSGAILYGRFLSLSGLPILLGNTIEAANVPPMVVLGMILLIYLFLGCIIDSISMMTVTLPIAFPISQAMGWDPIWFGILVILAAECGLLTPPLGINVFVTKAAAGPVVTLEELYRAVVPFFFVMLLGLILLVIFPQISMWLPGIMIK